MEALESLLGPETEGSRPIGIHPEVETMCSCGRLAFLTGFLVLCLGALFLVLDGQSLASWVCLCFRFCAGVLAFVLLDGPIFKSILGTEIL